LYHIDDLPTPPESMREHFRMFFEEVAPVQLRYSAPYDCDDGRIAQLGDANEALGNVPGFRGAGRKPTLEELGYRSVETFRRNDMHTDMAWHGGEKMALLRLKEWLTIKNLSSYVSPGRSRSHRLHLDNPRQARLSPWIAHGCLSPRRFIEELKALDFEAAASGYTTLPLREALHRLSRRDFAHFMGVKWGRRLFFPYGPRPEDTGDLPDQRLDRAIVQKWCAGLTGVPFVDAAMIELSTTGWASHTVRGSAAWMLSRGLGQDWRAGAEWFERCSLDYDPFITYWQFAYHSRIIRDRFDDRVRSGLYNAYKADSTGIYVRSWLPQLTRVPSTYIHRPHVITPKMQRMFNLVLGRNYPYPIKLWRGAQREFDALPAYFGGGSNALRPGMFEATRFNPLCMSKAEAHPCVTPEGLRAALAIAPAEADEMLEHLVRRAKASKVEAPKLLAASSSS
jgi:deoxyribodipyrimidine photo-lyase